MTVLDHHIVPSRDRDAAAGWLSEMLGLAAPRREGPFAAVDVGPTSLFFAGWDDEVAHQHYAFAVTSGTLDEIVGRLEQAKVTYWAEHDLREPNSVRRDESGAGIYFRSSEGHLLEVLTRT